MIPALKMKRLFRQRPKFAHNAWMKLSRSDRHLLDLLQQDATLSQDELAGRVGLSRTSCWRRLRDLEQAGFIERRVAVLNPRLAGIHIHVLLAVALTEHSDENRHRFESHIARLDEVMECYSVSGERDYVLQVAVPDMEAYNDFLNSQILTHPVVRSASSTFALRRVKYTTRLPLR
jgi:DNA-binding Lrp family transcriptional regulator